MKIKPIKAFKVLFDIQNERDLFPLDFEEFHKEIIAKVRPYTMTSIERLFSLIEAVRYVVKNDIKGSFVECGVWNGGSMMAIAETLKRLGVKDRHLYLYDTYCGMTEPTENDIDQLNVDAGMQLEQNKKNKETSTVWAFSTLSEVKLNLSLIGYPEEYLHFIEGDVLKTIPINHPGEISLLRLDTDWYESTKHEIEHLYPLLESNGVLIIDDYGFWKGSRKAIDEYIESNNISILLNRIDNTGRIAIKK